MDNSVFYKRGSKNAVWGFEYEFKIAAFAILRLSNRASEFYLADNFKRGEKFDDLAMSYAVNGVWSTIFVQIKHKSTKAGQTVQLSSLKDKKDFELMKYYKSFCKIKARFANPHPEDVVYRNDWGQAKLVIFTNAVFEGDVERRETGNDAVKILTSNGAEEVIFQLPSVPDDFLTEGDDHEEFLSRLWFCSGQLSEGEMDDAVNEEIKIALAGLASNSLVETTRLGLYQLIKKWSQSKNAYFMTRAHLEEFFSRTVMKNMPKRTSDITVGYSEGFFGQLVTQQGVVVVTVEKNNVAMARAALQHLFPQATWIKDTKLYKYRKYFETFWDISRDEVVVIECKGEEGGWRDVEESVTALSKDQNLLVLLVSGQDKQIESMADMKINFECTPMDLTLDSRKKLGGKVIVFQGCAVEVSALLGDAVDAVMDLDTMSALFQGQLVQVGGKLKDSIGYYVDRQLKATLVTRKIFDTVSDLNVVAVSGISAQKLKMKIAGESSPDSRGSNDTLFPEHTLMKCQVYNDTQLDDMRNCHDDHRKFVVLSDERKVESLRRLRAMFGNVHWISKGKDDWCWRASVDFQADEIESVLYRHDVSSWELDDKIVLVTGEAGMGKSVFLAHLAAESKKKDPLLWVIKLALNDYTHCLKTIDDEASAVRVLQDCAGVSTEFEQSLFHYSYTTPGRMLLLLDGFDEVSTVYADAVCRFLSILEKSPVSQVWITSRPLAAQQLQFSMETTTVTLEPFAGPECKMFLSKFCASRGAGRHLVKMEWNLLESLFNHDTALVLGVPLQVKFITEMLDKHLGEYEQGKQISNHKLNLLDLMENFVESKLKIWLQEKDKFDLTNAGVQASIKWILDPHQKDLTTMALIAVVPRQFLHDLCPPITEEDVKKMKQEVLAGTTRSGIVSDFHGGAPRFVHPAFAEYFAAVFLLKNYESNRRFLAKSWFYLTPSYAVVLHLFNRMLARNCDLHNAVFDGDSARIVQLMKDEGKRKELDLGGRNVSHIAAMTGQWNFERSVLQGMDQMLQADLVMGWSPSKYHRSTLAINGDTMARKPSGKLLGLSQQLGGPEQFCSDIDQGKWSRLVAYGGHSKLAYCRGTFTYPPSSFKVGPTAKDYSNRERNERYNEMVQASEEDWGNESYDSADYDV